MATNLEEKMDVVPNDNYILKTMNKPMNEEWKVSDGKIVKTEVFHNRTIGLRPIFVCCYFAHLGNATRI